MTGTRASWLERSNEYGSSLGSGQRPRKWIGANESPQQPRGVYVHAPGKAHVPAARSAIVGRMDDDDGPNGGALFSLMNLACETFPPCPCSFGAAAEVLAGVYCLSHRRCATTAAIGAIEFSGAYSAGIADFRSYSWDTRC